MRPGWDLCYCQIFKGMMSEACMAVFEPSAYPDDTDRQIVQNRSIPDLLVTSHGGEGCD